MISDSLRTYAVVVHYEYLLTATYMAPRNIRKTGVEGVAVHCPSCSIVLGRGQMLRGKTGAQLTHYTCTDCHQHAVSLVFRTQVGLSTVVLATDLSHADILRTKDADVVTADDVLGLHELLSQRNAALMLVAAPQ